MALHSTMPCPYCQKMNPVPEDELGRTTVCQWCHRKYGYSAAGFAVASVPGQPKVASMGPLVAGSVVAPSAPPAPGGLVAACPNCGAINLHGARFCSSCGLTMPEPDKLAELAALKVEVGTLRRNLTELESRLPNTGLLSDNFWTRAWAVFGHSLAVGAIIYGAVLLLAMIFVRR